MDKHVVLEIRGGVLISAYSGIKDLTITLVD